VGSKNTQRLQFSPPPVRNLLHYLYSPISSPALSTQHEWCMSSKALQLFLPFSFNISTPTAFNTVPASIQRLISTILCKQTITVRVLPITKNQTEQRYRPNLDPRNHSQTDLPNLYSHSHPMNCSTRLRKVELTVRISAILTDKHNSTSVPTTYPVSPLQLFPLLTYNTKASGIEIRPTH
jgi:hypothetical protein